MKFEQYLIETAIKKPIVYHGSYTAGIKKFSIRRKISETGVRHFGSYFTDSVDMAKTFGKHIYKVQLHFKKILDMTKWGPLRADDNFIKAIPGLKPNEVDEYLRFEYRGFNSPYNVIETLDGKYDILKRWKRLGFDGVAFWEEHFSKRGITYIPFHQSQIEILETNEI
jgi:hypothetical protein